MIKLILLVIFVLVIVVGGGSYFLIAGNEIVVDEDSPLINDALGKKVDGWDVRNVGTRVQIENISTNTGSSGQLYGAKDFAKFKAAYGTKYPSALIGRPVISVYSTTSGERLTGLIPLRV